MRKLCLSALLWAVSALVPGASAGAAEPGTEAQALLAASPARVEGLKPVPDLMDPSTSRALRLKYELLEKSQELRRGRGACPEEALQAERRSLGSEVVSEVGRYQVDSGIRRVAGTAKNQSALESNQKPVLIAAAAAALYFGQPIKISATESTSFRLRSELRSRRAELAMSNPFVRSQIDYDGNGESASVLGSSAHETARVSLLRDLPVYELGSRLTYGASTSTLTASLSKQVTREVAVSVDSARKASGTDGSEESIRVSYQLSF